MPATRRSWIVAAVVLLAAAPPSDAPKAIGSWLLQCKESGCSLRNRDWILPPGASQFAAALEVQRRGGSLVPVVMLRGLSTQQAIGGLLALQPRVTLHFTPGPNATLDCEIDDGAVICAPQGDAVATTSAALPSARQVEVGVQVGAPGLMRLPSQGRVLELQRTPEALVRLRSAGAAGESLPAEPGLDWIGLVHKIMQAAGFNPLGGTRDSETH
ncbi:MAG TPA: hypothetical protein VMB73_32130 [Acetobacteraceae bacterium]|nr:hypothetical protein [Acetobacteraceae bacterium]